MRQCSICSHKYRARIDHEILNGTPYRNITELYNVSLGAIARHKEHIAARDYSETEDYQKGPKRNSCNGPITEQSGTQAEQIRNKTEQSYTEQAVTPAEQDGTKRNKTEQPAGQDNTGQEVLTGVIETLQREIERQGETIKQMLQDHAKERERADTIIMRLRGDIQALNEKVYALTEGDKQEPETTPEGPEAKEKQETPDQGEPEVKPHDTAEQWPEKQKPANSGKTQEKKDYNPEDYKLNVGDRLWLLKEDIKRILNKRIF